MPSLLSYFNLLYIFWFLHQTTTVLVLRLLVSSCISFDSYIKPQLRQEGDSPFCVVYLLIPTSNHNHVYFVIFHNQVVYLLIPTSNHNGSCTGLNRQKLYIFWFLHQTTTIRLIIGDCFRCISFDSYIKPQQPLLLIPHSSVVYLLIPTSNHNLRHSSDKPVSVVYLLIPTSSHNW